MTSLRLPVSVMCKASGGALASFSALLLLAALQLADSRSEATAWACSAPGGAPGHELGQHIVDYYNGTVPLLCVSCSARAHLLVTAIYSTLVLVAVCRVMLNDRSSKPRSTILSKTVFASFARMPSPSVCAVASVNQANPEEQEKYEQL
jgi:hypothetical protein